MLLHPRSVVAALASNRPVGALGVPILTSLEQFDIASRNCQEVFGRGRESAGHRTTRRGIGGNLSDSHMSIDTGIARFPAIRLHVLCVLRALILRGPPRAVFNVSVGAIDSRPGITMEGAQFGGNWNAFAFGSPGRGSR
jgi:hypothetical protein